MGFFLGRCFRLGFLLEEESRPYSYVPRLHDFAALSSASSTFLFTGSSSIVFVVMFAFLCTVIRGNDELKSSFNFLLVPQLIMALTAFPLQLLKFAC